ncbi:MAG TPA: sigma factor-like helix-turn-helix DNA-binding protein [Solirubrobacteraceae bacterium]|nr:sigma factor-like helix-turn-helix DNA-binding protein [Solirubrobacteraceae bacterium]
MALDSLPGDQRAVLQLVLARRRGYEEIASMLSIPSEAVRGRALGALDALGSATSLMVGERQLIGDYLLSQLPAEAEADARQLLAHSPPARDWALALTPVLEPVAADPLPRIPAPAALRGQPAIPPAPGPRAAAPPLPALGPAEEPRDAERPSSRRGGMVVIGLALAVIVAAVVVLLVTRHNARSHASLAAATRPASTRTASGSSTRTTSGSTTRTTSGSTTRSPATSAVKYLAQINLRPVTAGSRAVGIAEVVRQEGVREIAIIGQHIPPNTKSNSYEVWLYSSPTHFEKLGFVSPAVGRAGTFSDARVLPPDASRYRELIVTTETARKPAHPGAVLLRGTIGGL